MNAKKRSAAFRFWGFVVLLAFLTGCRSPAPEAAPLAPTDTASPQVAASPTIAHPATALQPTALSTQLFEPLHSAADCQSLALPEIACTGVAANDEWEPVIREFDGAPMALVPAGCFEMGNADGLAEERPVHQICFDRPFWLDLTEVTAAHFAAFLTARQADDDYAGWLDPWGVALGDESWLQFTHRDDRWRPKPALVNRPVESVTGFGAEAYCSWRGARLLTEAEWEYAARGPDALLYPWGNEFIATNVARFQGQMPEVGSKPQGASWVGALDMSSSLYEWTSSIYRPYPYDPKDGRETPLEMDETSARVLRGGAWYHKDGMMDNLSATARFMMQPATSVWPYGIRCGRDFAP